MGLGESHLDPVLDHSWAAEACQELLKCGCKKSCTKRCKCVKDVSCHVSLPCPVYERRRLYERTVDTGLCPPLCGLFLPGSSWSIA